MLNKEKLKEEFAAKFDIASGLEHDDKVFEWVYQKMLNQEEECNFWKQSFARSVAEHAEFVSKVMNDDK